MLVKINIADNNDGFNIIAENVDALELIAEVDSAPNVAHVVVSDIPQGFMQLVHPGKFGEYMDMTLIDEISAIKVNIGEVLFSQQNTLNELRLMNEIVNSQLALVQVYELIIGG